jgi:hypothetical protein
METCELEYVMQTLYVGSIFHEHGRLEDFMKCAGEDTELSPDTMWDVIREPITEVFQDTRYYYHEAHYNTVDEYVGGLEIFVMRDPLLSRYDRLCREYELRKGFTKVEDPFAADLESAVHRAMQMRSYCYEYRWYDGTMDKKGPRLVLMLDEEFDVYIDIPEALFEILDFCQDKLPALEHALAELDARIIDLPVQTTTYEEAA